MRRRKNRTIFVLIVILMIFIINLKPIGRKIYPIKYYDYIVKYSEEYDLNPFLVTAVIKVESNFNRNAVSVKNAQGLMQLTPSTAKWAAEQMKLDDFSVDMLHDPEVNIRMGCWYLNNLKEEFGPNIELILAAYNGGRGNVKKWLNNYENSTNGIELNYIPFEETDKYVKKVQVNYNLYKFLYTQDNNYASLLKQIISNYF
ncbi:MULTISPECIES: lytic transglycosylase domain-containing protein [Clostridium]|uniref:Soluble lytic murein transglycosylase n=2 Tax=Clostridium TaxID=1485 RepID=A0A151ARR3_9CLOT|nr:MULTISPECIES: lytic transglycosylase domain-containing protein [Clostridium]KYH30270.1 soluble lytic murein transglycosylase precursor [Clostridium colicanis DSM 13634]MBE6044503.1 lytic transglycosylase domain-containing protein [Clostridium thermopalmarium]PRR69384.1 Soluble lytic murein transglycosylase precursor [Clostridium thermopalmarium DSM 5974]PVZ26350.1 soluble lytic murein transglycosylase [Clostridium thermopalmarium DSM 5974]